MTPIEFTVEGVPVGKGRPRACRVGNGIRMYSPAATERYESLVRDAFNAAISKRHPGLESMLDPIASAIQLTVLAYFPIPKSRSKKFHAAAELENVPVTTRPDFDNVGKIVSDALNGVAWRDDALVSYCIIVKRYSLRPRVEIRIAEDQII